MGKQKSCCHWQNFWLKRDSILEEVYQVTCGLIIMNVRNNVPHGKLNGEYSLCGHSTVWANHANSLPISLFPVYDCIFLRDGITNSECHNGEWRKSKRSNKDFCS